LHSSTNSAVEPWTAQASASFAHERGEGRDGLSRAGRDIKDNEDSSDNVDRAACANLWKFIGFTCHWG
ncbi:hypothetical protein ABTD78_25495, partial [Acinetobacter baumannii]